MRPHMPKGEQREEQDDWDMATRAELMSEFSGS